MDSSREDMKEQLDSPFIMKNGNLCQETKDPSYIDMRQRWQRFLVLGLKEIIDEFQITNVEFGMLFSIYSIPNIFLALLMGYFTDRIGIRNATTIYTLATLIGQLLFALSPIVSSYNLALIGRLIHGVSSEALSMAVVIIINQWFLKAEIGLAFAIMITLAKGGVSLTNLVTPQILVQSGGSIVQCLNFGVLLTLIAFMFALLFSKIDKYNEEHVELERSRVSSFNNLQMNAETPAKKGFISCKLIKDLDMKIWVFCLVFFLSYSTFGPYQNNVSMILRTRFNFDILEAGQIMKNTDSGNCSTIAYILALLHIPVARFNEIIDKERQGFGVGLSNSAQNLGNSISPILIGMILDNQDKESNSLANGYQQISLLLGFESLAFLSILAMWSIQLMTRKSRPLTLRI
ncbi:major facilitator superfamily protein [Stylonychia lemnae]|uniref:Lysosomal dipeptide transporter MFSD1 n=1 Tax=Stylonychia lemnae TaxID=5949 RepID=A0A078AE15_STYLE|nr:major facilitator superfamily protein [Stylonychia lemnae]|eukprot:CDW80086.1 major facilitator superfamily protein [Stylonychia lemnae]